MPANAWACRHDSVTQDGRLEMVWVDLLLVHGRESESKTRTLVRTSRGSGQGSAPGIFCGRAPACLLQCLHFWISFSRASMASKRPKGKGKAPDHGAETSSACSCCGAHTHQSPLPPLSSASLSGGPSKCGHPPLSAAEHRRLTAVLASLFSASFLTSLTRCHGILIGVTYEVRSRHWADRTISSCAQSVAYGFIKRALTQDNWTPAHLRIWLDGARACCLPWKEIQGAVQMRSTSRLSRSTPAML
jgi:hypothetical protein